jgi:hypothetical protein
MTGVFRRQHGMVLLPVTLVLATVGALAYAMTRDGAMNVNAIDTQYQIDKARYLAEAGVNLVRWRNEQLGCGSALGFTGTVTGVDGGTIVANNADIQFDKKNGLAMTVTATTTAGAVNQVVRDVPHAVAVYDLSKKVEVTVGAQNGADAFIRSGAALTSGMSYLEVTDDTAHGLLKFGLPSLKAGIMISHADLTLYQASNQSTQPVSLSVHRLTTAWNSLTTWSFGWAVPGGDYAPEASATVPVTGNGAYTLRIDPLVQTWASGDAPNNGMLLRGAGLNVARFSSFEANNNQPQIFLRYFPQCS